MHFARFCGRVFSYIKLYKALFIERVGVAHFTTFDVYSLHLVVTNVTADRPAVNK